MHDSSWKPGSVLPHVTQRTDRTGTYICAEGSDGAKSIQCGHRWNTQVCEFVDGPESDTDEHDGPNACSVDTSKGGMHAHATRHARLSYQR